MIHYRPHKTQPDMYVATDERNNICGFVSGETMQNHLAFLYRRTTMQELSNNEIEELVELPTFIEWDNREFSKTGKLGRNIATGTPSAEYCYKGEGVERRVWLTTEGEKTEE